MNAIKSTPYPLKPLHAFVLANVRTIRWREKWVPVVGKVLDVPYIGEREVKSPLRTLRRYGLIRYRVDRSPEGPRLQRTRQGDLALWNDIYNHLDRRF